MGDDLFDQIVEDAIAEETRRDEAEETEPEAAEAEASANDEEFEIDDELLAIDEPEDQSAENPSASNFELNAPDEPAADEPAKPAAKPKAEGAQKAGDSKVGEGDSAIDGKGAAKGALPLSTGSFTHRDYQVVGTLSMVSARRVVATDGWSTEKGRSAEGEKAVAAAERELKIELRAQAAKRGGHAVVGVAVHLVAPGNGLLVLQATGTPVRLKKRADRK